MKCTACGAQIGSAEVNCRFCGAVTPFGRRQQDLHNQHQANVHAWNLHREHEQALAKQQAATRAIKRAADASLWWGIGAVVTCCLFVPGLVAVVLGFRARSMARKYDRVVPTNATIGTILGFLSTAFGISVVSMGAIQDYRRASTIEDIQEQLEGKLERAALEQPTACLLTKRSLLKGEYDDDEDLDDFECDGKLTLSGESAVLEDVRFKRSSTRHELRVCLEKGARWRVVGFRLKNGCDEPDDTVSSVTVTTSISVTARGSATNPLGSALPGASATGVPLAPGSPVKKK